MTPQTLIAAKYHAQEIGTIEELIRVAFELGKLAGMEEARQDIPINAISQARGYQQGYNEALENVDKDKVLLSHLIPETGLRKWNEMTANERMEKMHQIWDQQKAKEIF